MQYKLEEKMLTGVHQLFLNSVVLVLVFCCSSFRVRAAIVHTSLTASETG